MTNFQLIFGLSLGANCILTAQSSSTWRKWTGQDFTEDLKIGDDKKNEAGEHKKWKTLIRKYLGVYLLATLSDWLQGPYVYALYADYGYTHLEIAVLFLAGFGSSMVFGSFIGSMADQFGRRRFVVLFAALSASSCVTKHFKYYGLLLLGRTLSGIASSLLYSVFEAWLIRSHTDTGLEQKWLAKSFNWAAYTNSIVAIIAGLVANRAASSTLMFPLFESSDDFTFYFGGFLGPFDVAICACSVCAFLAATTWEEQRCGDGKNDDGPLANETETTAPKWYEGLYRAAVSTYTNKDILMVGLISSLFEGSMYIFVFMWTPALKADDGDDKQEEEDLPFGLIFSTFMVCCMAGSSLSSILMEKYKYEFLAVVVLITAAAAQVMIALSESQTLRFLAMNLFELTVGMYWPIMGLQKGSIVPESKRAALYNLFRIPLNLIVMLSLLTSLTSKESFQLNAAMLIVATTMQIFLRKRRENNGTSSAASGNEPSMIDDLVSQVPSPVYSPELKDSFAKRRENDVHNHALQNMKLKDNFVP